MHGISCHWLNYLWYTKPVVIYKKIGLAKMFMLFIISHHFNSIMTLNSHEQKWTG